MKIKAFLAVALVGMVSSVAHAGFIPFGLQSGVSSGTVNGWGWSECHRSGGSELVGINSVLSACNGTHLMMGVWDMSQGLFSILGAGDSAVVQGITYADFNSDNGGTTLNNWSNGLNFYRTGGAGSWGFTTNTLTELNSADIFLLNGLQAQNGQTEGVLSAGLSFHINGTDLTSGWAYNTTGSNFMSVNNSTQRVFFVMNVIEPSTVASFAAGLLGLVFWRRNRKVKTLN